MIPKTEDLLDGVYPAVVTQNTDPLNVGRIKVVFPWDDDEAESHWARLVQPYAGNKRGLYFVPEIGDEVVVIFELGDINQPLVIGGTWNGKDEPPEPADPDGANHHKVIETRCGHKLHFDDTPGNEFIQINDCSLNNIVRWDTRNNTMSITALTGDIIVRAPVGNLNMKARELYMRVTDSSKRKVSANETIVVKESAKELQDNSKKWTAATKLNVTTTTVDLTASQTFEFKGGDAKIDVTNQELDRIVIKGKTNETTNQLDITSKEIYERADRRTWQVGTCTINAQNIYFDASGALTCNAATYNGKAGGGEFTLRGQTVTVQGGLINWTAGQININPKKASPTGRGNKQKGGVKDDSRASFWAEFVVVDPAGRPLKNAEYTLTTPDGAKHKGKTGPDGTVYVNDIPDGQCEVELHNAEIELDYTK